METSMTPKVQELTDDQCWQLLRAAPFGRLAVVMDGRPDVFPVNHIVDRGTLVFRTDSGTKLMGAVGQPVAFEVDGVDEASSHVWSVVAKGLAQEVRQLHEVVDTAALPLFPWQGGSKPHFVRIQVEDLTGRRFARTAAVANPAAAPYTAPRTAED
jgi:uncharacterized protein